MQLSLACAGNIIHLVSAYAPTLPSSEEAKDAFYDQLASIIQPLPNAESLFILGDFNARVGADNSSWEHVLIDFMVLER